MLGRAKRAVAIEPLTEIHNAFLCLFSRCANRHGTAEREVEEEKSKELSSSIDERIVSYSLPHSPVALKDIIVYKECECQLSGYCITADCFGVTNNVV